MCLKTGKYHNYIICRLPYSLVDNSCKTCKTASIVISDLFRRTGPVLFRV